MFQWGSRYEGKNRPDYSCLLVESELKETEQGLEMETKEENSIILDKELIVSLLEYS